MRRDKPISILCIIIIVLVILPVSLILCVYTFKTLDFSPITEERIKGYGPFVAAFVALFVGVFGDRMKKWVETKPLIKIDSRVYLKTFQFDFGEKGKIPREYYRLMIVNDSNVLAKKVEIRVESINEGKIIRNLIPTPLYWTHKNVAERDIFPHQLVYLDFIMCTEYKFTIKKLLNFKDVICHLYNPIFILNELRNNISILQINKDCKVKLGVYGENFSPQTLWISVTKKRTLIDFPEAFDIKEL